MKRFIAAVLTVMFVGTGVVMAQTPDATAAPVVKKAKKHHKKKMAAPAAAAATTPAAN
jgi:hypothetical protein